MSEELVNLRAILQLYIDFLQPFRLLLNTHNVQFIEDDLWHNDAYITPSIRACLEQLVQDSIQTKEPVNLVKIFNDLMKSSQANDNKTNDLFNLFDKLLEFNRLWHEKVLTPPHLLINSQDSELNEFNETVNKKFQVMVKQNRFMNAKKAYEVDEMSKFVAKLCKKLDIHTIVDIGSGKAYLSAQLSSAVFENLFNVIAIDSSESNVDSSMKRLSMMKRRTTIFSIKRDRSSKVSTNLETTSKDEESPYFKLLDPTKFQTFAQFIQSSTELNELIRVNLNLDESECQDDERFALIGLHSCGNLSNSIINLFLSSKRENEINNSKKNNNRLLCNVACCYNLLNEKYANDVESYIDVKKTNVKIGDESKFPMSQFLNEKKYAINFNARSLGCHSLDRCFTSLNDYRELDNTILWYRVVLQVILIDKYFEHFASGNRDEFNNTSIKIGRKFITEEKELPKFAEYVRRAIAKLGLSSEQLTDDEIEGYFKRHEHLKLKFDAYVQLKLLIAPVIEYIVLLDRLIYLHESTSNLDSEFKYKHHLVKLFDPALSPRCHATVSYYE